MQHVWRVSLENYLEVSYAYYNMMCISKKVELQRISRRYFMQTPSTHPSSICTFTHLSIQSYVHVCMHPSLIPTIIPLPLHSYMIPSIYPSTYPIRPHTHPCVCLHLYIHIYVHTSFHPPSIFLSSHPPITDPHMHTLLHSVRKVSVIQSVLVLIVWDELESALFSFPENLGILCNRPSAGTDLASENFDSMWAILWLHSLLFPWLHEYRKCPLNGTNEKEEASECISELSWQPSVGPETNIAILYTFFIIRDKTHSWMIQ